MNKSTLRTFHITQRRRLSLVERRKKSDYIRSNAQRLINWHAVGTIHAYQSNSQTREVDTAWVGAYVYSMWADIALNIADVSPAAKMPEGRFDVIIVPVVAFHPVSIHRLGFGGGWYDRFLQGQPDAVKIGLAYEFQREPNIEIEPHDVRLDFIITEDNVYGR